MRNTAEIDKVFDALSIRDTVNHDSTISNSEGFKVETVAIINKLDQDIVCQFQGSMEVSFTDVFDIGDPFSVLKNTNDFQNTDTYFPFMRVSAICAVQPTTGVLTIFLAKVA